MMNPSSSAIATLMVVAARVASAQAPTWMTLDLRATHPVLRPGQVQEIELWCSFTPKGTPVFPSVSVSTFGLMTFDVLNRGEFDAGSITGFHWKHPMIAIMGTVQPNGDITKSGVYLDIWGFVPSSNPIHLVTFDWTPDPELGPRRVSIETDVQPSYNYALWLYGNGKYQLWKPDVLNHDSASWMVVPAPGATGVLGMALLMAGLRRRR